MAKVLITTVPFGENTRLPFELLEKARIEYLVNPLGKKLTENEVAHMVRDYDAIIAGTEPITDKVLESAKNLKMISRVGIGLDSVNLNSAKTRGINVSYTPDAPAPAVAELTIGLILNLLRSVHISNTQMHQGLWNRYLGRRLEEVTIGIIGVGRIGRFLLRKTKGFGISKILVNDISPNRELDNEFKLEWTAKENIYKEADIITLHLPLTHLTRNMILKKELQEMKRDAILINTSRGGIINELDLYHVMKTGHLSGAAIDVFEQEPYKGPLSDLDRCLLTAHMGSMSIDCRAKMELEATEEVVRFFSGKTLEGEVPEAEYDEQNQNYNLELN